MCALTGRDSGSAETSGGGPVHRKPHIMVVDDNIETRASLQSLLLARGYEAVATLSATEAVQRFHSERPAAVILDIDIPGVQNGLLALNAFRTIDRQVPVIVLSSEGLTTTAMQVLPLGSTYFVQKPFQSAELAVRLSHALNERQATREVASLREQLQSHPEYPMLFGRGERMAEIAVLIERVADTDVTVLIRGESGTGKELVARALATSSHRRHLPFVKVNCAAIPSELLEAELFGFERGAFTSAVQHKPGKFEFANHGTMFLDEIGDVSLSMQGKLLHVLQDGEFSRLGGTRDLHVDARVIAATNRDLDRAVAEGQFRKDLFFRLNVISITLPPLRERREDIPLLTDHFFRKHSAEYNKPLSTLPPDVVRLLMEHDWPGNIRELENLIRRAVVLGSNFAIGKEISHSIALAKERPVRRAAPIAPPPVAREAAQVQPRPVAPPRDDRARPPTGPAMDADSYSLKAISRDAARHAERELILRVLQRTRWNRKAAAGLLHISYKALLYKMKENGLDDQTL